MSGAYPARLFLPDPNWWRRRREPPRRFKPRRHWKRYRATISLLHSSGNAGTTASLAITVTSTTAGSDLVICVASRTAANITTITDNASGGTSIYKKLNANQNLNAGSNLRSEIWVARGVKSGITTVTVKQSSSGDIAASCGEYSGVFSYGYISNFISTSSLTSATISLTTTASNNYMVACFSISNTGSSLITATSGTAQYQNFTPSACALAYFDNTAGSPGSVTCAGNFDAASYHALTAVELQTAPVAPPAPAPVFMSATTGLKTATTGTTLSIAVSSAQGDPIFIGVSIPSATISVASIADASTTNKYVRLGIVINGALTTELWCTASMTPAAPGSVTITFSATGATASAQAATYWSVNGVSRVGTNSGSSTSMTTGAQTLLTPNAFLISNGSKTSVAAYSAISNNSRASNTATGVRGLLQDSIGASSPVTDSATMASGIWGIVYAELDASPFPLLPNSPRTLPQPHVLLNF